MDGKVTNLKSKLDTYKAMSGGGNFAGCPVRNVIQGVSGKWRSLLVMALAERPYRFGELRRLVPDISQRMLTQTLHDLQRDGYVHREVFPTKPPSVEYSLTDLGRSMFGAFHQLILWAELNHDAVREARADFDAAQA
ncbi:helix-turn-helix transcriptional regulator [Mesorhizobium sp. B2-4-2]|uniref:winged helix-turn-helix transcriptional regulator n=1 Tax=Mesorhizobium sp. B2-4-2 TaxID=2589947 RepID=UPI00112B1EC8|nr:helix-turn-helix domain-containing protein [Mesorhizobium sp. B2-4-2]TPL56279.1 helix-turn-helix transcriptional regulator [Mesorhizobium sp. B2-4-2]